MTYSFMADCARMKWYIRLASRFMRKMELKIMTRPWRRSALWYDVRLDGVDLVRRCRKVEWCDLPTGRLDPLTPALVLLCILPFSGRRCVGACISAPLV